MGDIIFSTLPHAAPPSSHPSESESLRSQLLTEIS
jgi:hypothetical protein